ncbi:MAG: hypothetical protein GY796_16685 [Chloroflexi bacterium]|nr:hypothetical protein [Chloroflexota bacterium]
MTFNTPPLYRTFILRFWEERTADTANNNTWRFSLEDPETNARHVFQNLEGVVAFLRKQTNVNSN